MSDCVDTAERLLPLLEPQHLSNIFWALAKLEYHPGKSHRPYIFNLMNANFHFYMHASHAAIYHVVRIVFHLLSFSFVYQEMSGFLMR